MKNYPNFRVLERCHGVTWHDLVELEPRLADLLWEARQACVACSRWSDVDRAFAPIRDTLSKLVGFAGKKCLHPVLGSAGAYDVAYWKLYDAVAGLLPVRPSGSEEAMKDNRSTESLPHEAGNQVDRQGLSFPAVV
jgi:hypothetical protein